MIAKTVSERTPRQEREEAQGVFGFIGQSLNSRYSRAVGFVRNMAQIIFTSHVHNMLRYEQIKRLSIIVTHNTLINNKSPSHLKKRNKLLKIKKQNVILHCCIFRFCLTDFATSESIKYDAKNKN